MLRARLLPAADDGRHPLTHFAPGSLSIAKATQKLVVIGVDVANVSDHGEADRFWTQCLCGSGK